MRSSCSRHTASGLRAIGLCWGLADRYGWGVHTRTFLFVGILGSFTTFSSFGLETLRLMQAGAMGQAALYVVGSNLVGIALVWAGFSATR